MRWCALEPWCEELRASRSHPRQSQAWQPELRIQGAAAGCLLHSLSVQSVRAMPAHTAGGLTLATCFCRGVSLVNLNNPVAGAQQQLLVRPFLVIPAQLDCWAHPR